MSITVADCLGLGVLKDATVVAGFNGLNRIVESVTVFEFDGHQIESISNVMGGNEMAIGAFSFFKGENVDKFVRFVKSAINSGISCLVFFYIGHVLEKIPEEILTIADEMNVPIISFPPTAIHSYADAIMAVSETIINDKHANTMFVSNVIDQMLSLEETQQNNQTLLNLLSEKTDSDLILTDETFTPFIWSIKHNSINPTELLHKLHKTLMNQLPSAPKIVIAQDVIPNIHLRLQPIRLNKLVGYLIAVNQISMPFNIDAVSQASEVLRLFLRIWRLSSAKMSELNALLEGGISTVSVSVSQIRHITVILGKDQSPLSDIMDQFEITQSLQKYNAQELYNQYKFTFFDGSIVVASNKTCNSIMHHLKKIAVLLKKHEPLSVGECNIMPGQNVHQVYTIIRKALPVAKKVFPDTSVFSEEKIKFAHGLLMLKRQRDEDIDSFLQIISPLQKDDCWEKHFETLSTLYLDCDGSIGEAANKLGVHINTIKYRLQSIQKISLLNLNSAITQSQLSYALAIIRLR